MTRVDEEEFTVEQKSAISSRDQFLQIIAGPGTGKTFTLAHRIALQIRNGADPSRLVAASFTNDACKTLKEHLRLLIGDSVDQIKIFTFHGFARFILEQEMQKTDPTATLNIADEWDSKTLLKGLRPALTVARINQLPLDELAQIDSFAEYLRRLEAHRLVDFRHLLVHAKKAASSIARSYDHLFVDEFQDTSPEQFNLLQHLIWGNPELAVTVVGDPNQSIYGSSDQQGRDLLPFPAFESLCSPATCHLKINFRSSEPLVRFTNTQMPIENPQVSSRASSLESSVPTLVSLNALGHYSQGKKIPPIDQALVNEIRAVKRDFDQVAVLTYTNKAVAHIIELLKRHGIPYFTSFNKAMFTEPNSKLVYLLFRYVKQPTEIQLLSFLDQSNILSKACRTQLETKTNDFTHSILDQFDGLVRIKNHTELLKLKKILEIAVPLLQFTPQIDDVRYAVKLVLDAVPGAKLDTHVGRLLEAIETQLPSFNLNSAIVPQFMQHLYAVASNSQGAVNVRTIHSSKGMEWLAVVIPYLGSVDSNRFYQPWGYDQKYQNTLYVGMTRARDKLTLLSTGYSRLDNNPALRVVGEQVPSDRLVVQKMFPKLFSPLKFKTGAFGPSIVKRGIHMRVHAKAFALVKFCV